MHRIFLPAIAVSLLCGSAPLLAQSRRIEFTVPVKLTSFNGRQAWVWCELRDAGNRGLVAGYSIIAVTNGTATQSVKVTLWIEPNQEALIAGWRAVLTAPDPKSAYGGGAGTAKYTAIPNLQVFGEISGKF